MEKLSPKEQLFLPIQTRLNKDFATFLGQKSEVLIECLKIHIDQLDEPLLVLTGKTGVGKSHLLEAAINYALAKAVPLEAAYFSLPELDGLDEAGLDYDELYRYFSSLSVLAIDDLDSWLLNLSPGERDNAELFLFNLYNEFKTNGKLLLIASKCPVSRLKIKLKDLQSRLASGLLLRIDDLNDQDKRLLLQHLTRLKGFTMDEEVSAYILKRSGRDVGSLLAVIDSLDSATLMEQKKLTVPFVKKVFNW